MRYIASAAATAVAASMLTGLGLAPSAAFGADPQPEMNEIDLAEISDSGIGIPGARDRSATAESSAAQQSADHFSFLPSLLRAPARGTSGTTTLAQPLAYPASPTGTSAPDSGSPDADAIHGSASDITEDGRTIAALSDVVEPADGAPGLVGVVWRGAEDAEVEIRTRTDGQWSAWSGLDTDNDPEQPGASGTEPYSLAGMDAAQLRILGDATPRDARILSIDPKRWSGDETAVEFNTPVTEGAADSAADQAPAASGTAATMAHAPGAAAAQTIAKDSGVKAPKIEHRKAWGAAKPKSDPDTTAKVQAAVVHHTGGSNDYTAEDVPAILRGIQHYHQQGRGWDDIGYNMLADKYGRLWEGRGGGLKKNPVGAHVVGYNQGSFGISVIGSYGTSAPPQATLDAVDHAIAWKLALSGVDAGGKTTLKGTKINVVSGHRDLGQTDCPGDALYGKLPQMRKDIAEIQKNGGPVKKDPPKKEKKGEKTDKKKGGEKAPEKDKQEDAGLQPGATDRNA
ncbi:peptidoglycan recognition protein family protein [Brevibacterium luteolum]|uniref:peptidoglycan recognition protein family protein n=1 Tax=Brevibacterium luteolum TaxID=199591 RepID=UPI00223B82D1|nr:peptidoglycan recognition protein [Brevibacterium luteolum]MCT1657502.1 peptidoglycan recognition protein [Brevibacterium luteolum]